MIISKIVKTMEYKCIAVNLKGEHHSYSWTNTNMLLKEGYDGFKTGVTPTAGPCLAATKKYGSVNLVIVVLHCKSCEYRWKEVNLIYAWASRVIGYIYETNNEDVINSKKLASFFYKVL